MKWRQSIGFRKILRLLHPHRQYILIFQVCATEYGETLEKSHTLTCTNLHIHHKLHWKWNFIYSCMNCCCCCCCYCLSFGITTIVKWLCSCWYVRIKIPFAYTWKCPCRPWSLSVLLLYSCRAIEATIQWKINDLRFHVNKFQTFSTPKLHFLYVKMCDRTLHPENENRFQWIIPIFEWIFEWMTQFHVHCLPHFNWNNGINKHMMYFKHWTLDMYIEMRERASMK